MKFTSISVLTGLCLLIFESNSYARGIFRAPGGMEEPKRKIARGEPPRDPSSMAERSLASELEPSSASRSSSGRTVSCEDANYIPLAMLNLISKSGKGIEIQNNLADPTVPPSMKKISVSIPEHIKACSAFIIKTHQDEGKNDIILTVENNFDFDAYLEGKSRIKSVGESSADTEKIYSKKDLSKMTAMEKYEACLTIEGVIGKNKDSGDPEIIWPKSGGYGLAIAEPMEVNFKQDQIVKMVFGSPRSGVQDYGHAYSKDAEVKPGFENPAKCLSLEDVAMGGMYLFDRTDVKYAQLREDCKGGPRRIREAFNKLGDFPESALFRKILKKQLAKEQNKDFDFEMRRLNGVGASILNSNDPSELEGLSQDYALSVRKIKHEYVEPKLESLRQLMAKRSMGRLSESELKDVDDEIFELNSDISRFSQKENVKTVKMDQVMDKLRNSGITDTANETAELRLMSGYFGRVYGRPKPGEKRGKVLTFEQASAEVHKQHLDYQVTSSIYLKKSMAMSGKYRFSTEYMRMIQQNQTQMSQIMQRHWENERKNMSFCSYTMIGSVQNPIKCKNANSPAAKQARQNQLNQQMRFYQNKINSDYQLYQQFTQVEQEAFQKNLNNQTAIGTTGGGEGSGGGGGGVGGVGGFSGDESYLNNDSPFSMQKEILAGESMQNDPMGMTLMPGGPQAGMGGRVGGLPSSPMIPPMGMPQGGWNPYTSGLSMGVGF